MNAQVELGPLDYLHGYGLLEDTPCLFYRALYQDRLETQAQDDAQASLEDGSQPGTPTAWINPTTEVTKGVWVGLGLHVYKSRPPTRA